MQVTAGGTNETTNGVALCTIHHEAYDRALIGITPDYEVRLSETTARRLRGLDRLGGLTEFRDSLRDNLLLPTRPIDYPDPENLRRALALRGWV